MANYMINRKLKNVIIYLYALIFPSRIARDTQYFRLWESKGVHIVPVNFYEPIPNTSTLKADLWKNQSELVGININEQAQIKLLTDFSTKFKHEYDNLPKERTKVPHQYYINNDFFFNVDAEILYSMIRQFKPKRLIEIGSGNSTLLSAQAIQKNKEENPNYSCELTAIEPYPNPILTEGFPGLSKLINKNVQEIPLSEFKRLEENDILFIDSSHVLNIGSDVQYEYLEILPRLRKGVLVHIHDIFMPAEYPKEWILNEYRFWTEQYLLQAFLTYNEAYEVVWAASYMHLRNPDKQEASFSSYQQAEKWTGSFWIRKTR
ncbi:MAG: hypothetical protein QG646_1106, partial [Euryarchaeota archaeon]|nr:hypothetical protein [Euryarchaeota archaeon]